MPEEEGGKILYMLPDTAGKKTLDGEIARLYRVGLGDRASNYPMGLGMLKLMPQPPFAVVIADGLAMNHSQGSPTQAVHDARQYRGDLRIVVVTANPDLRLREADKVIVTAPGEFAEAAHEVARFLGLAPRAVRQAWNIGFVSDKGGEGKSTVAMGLTLAMHTVLTERAKRHELPAPRLALIDLDLSDGNADILVADRKREDLPDMMTLLDPEEQLTVERIRAHMVSTALGIDVLLAPLELGMLMGITGETFGQVRKPILNWYDIVAVDHNSNMDAQVNAASLDVCDRIIAVLTPTVYGVQGMRRLLPRLSSLPHLDMANVRFVLNKALPEDRKLVAEFEAEFEVPCLGVLMGGTEEIRAFREAQRKGLPVPMRKKGLLGGSTVWDSFLEMAEKLLAEMPV